jgi:hypothetical protein
MTTDRTEMRGEEIARERAEILPDREAMSLFSTSPSPSLSGYGDVGSQEYLASPLGSSDEVSTTATETAEETYELADVDASASETGGVTDQDRSETFHQTDSSLAES